MSISLQAKNQGKLKKSFYLLAKQIVEIEDEFSLQIQTQINDELSQHQQYILSTYKYLEQLNIKK